MYLICCVLFCILIIVIVKHRQFLVLWSWSLPSIALEPALLSTFYQVRAATDYVFIISCAWGCRNKVEFFKYSHTETLWGTLVPWNNKLNLCLRIWKLLARFSIRHSEKVLYNQPTNNNNSSSNTFGHHMLRNQLCSYCFQIWIKEERK
jgi:hypothetical protein